MLRAVIRLAGLGRAGTYAPFEVGLLGHGRLPRPVRRIPLVTSVDGYYEGPNQEFDWPIVDQGFNGFAVQQLDEADTLLFRRVTHQGITDYWPGNVADEISALKRQSGKHITILGSSTLTADLIRLGLVDELRVMVMPVVLGGGRSLLTTIGDRIRLVLLKPRTFRSGNVLLTYRRTR